MNKIALCDRLKDERKRLGLTQAEFAKLGNVSLRAQQNYEKGDRRPDTNYLAALESALVDIGYILTGERERDPALLDLPSFERGIEVANRVLEITHALGVNPGREGTKQLCLYAHKYCPTKEGLKAYIESVYAIAQPSRDDANNEADEENVANKEDDDFDPNDCLDLGDRK